MRLALFSRPRPPGLSWPEEASGVGVQGVLVCFGFLSAEVHDPQHTTPYHVIPYRIYFIMLYHTVFYYTVFVVHHSAPRCRQAPASGAKHATGVLCLPSRG